MKEKVCKHQDTFFETDRLVHLSRCVNRRSDSWCNPISRLTCDTCIDRAEPEAEDFRLMETLPEIYEQPELPQRETEEQTRILQTFCFNCKHYNKKDKLCDSCACGAHIPIDELVKYKPFHCHLELW